MCEHQDLIGWAPSCSYLVYMPSLYNIQETSSQVPPHCDLNTGGVTPAWHPTRAAICYNLPLLISRLVCLFVMCQCFLAINHERFMMLLFFQITRVILCVYGHHCICGIYQGMWSNFPQLILSCWYRIKKYLKVDQMFI